MSICRADIFLDRKGVCVIIIVYVFKQESEVELINRQIFLADLGKLLTFMYEEDRTDALAMYSSMFDEAEDEQGLIELLMSPTRQAVVVAHAYDAKERKMQGRSRSVEDASEADGGIPDYAVAIEKVRSEAAERGLLRVEAPDEQVDFFAGSEEEPEAPDAEEKIESGEEKSDGLSAENVSENAEAEEVPAGTESIVGDDAGEAAEAAEEADVELPELEEPEKTFDYTKDIPDEDGYFEPQKEAMVGWLTLFVIFAIPVGLIACVLMIVLAAVFLALAAATVAAGVFAIRSLLSGFAVLADILLVGGAAIAALALGLLFLWTAIWCLFGAIPGIVRGIVELGRSWCYKEVAE